MNNNTLSKSTKSFTTSVKAFQISKEDGRVTVSIPFHAETITRTNWLNVLCGIVNYLAVKVANRKARKQRAIFDGSPIFIELRDEVSGIVFNSFFEPSKDHADYRVGKKDRNDIFLSALRSAFADKFTSGNIAESYNADNYHAEAIAEAKLLKAKRDADNEERKEKLLSAYANYMRSLSKEEQLALKAAEEIKIDADEESVLNQFSENHADVEVTV